MSGSKELERIDPVEFLGPQGRLFIDTNIWMDTSTAGKGGLKRLFERGQSTITKNKNPIIVPTKVKAELEKQAGLATDGVDAERLAAIKKAQTSLEFIEAASNEGLVKASLGHETNPYADDLFIELFERFAGKYEMCLLTMDITIKVRIRLLAKKKGNKRLLAGTLGRDGYIDVESDEVLYAKAANKLKQIQARVDQGTGDHKDKSEINSLGPLLSEFRNIFGIGEVEISKNPKKTTAKKTTKVSRASAGSNSIESPFKSASKIHSVDKDLSDRLIPKAGETVQVSNAKSNRNMKLGTLLGEGGEGRVYTVEGSANLVAKIFDKGHLTAHREAKIDLLIDKSLTRKGICFPEYKVKNANGEFVGYAMRKAKGKEFQRTIFNPKRFRETFPNWKKIDLVDVCISFLEHIKYLHSLNIIVGDINPKNLMVDSQKNVFIIDADSWQIEGYPCPVGTQMFTPPALLGGAYSEKLRTKEDENFAVATMLFMILITGQFPYMRKGTDGDQVKLIKEGVFAFQYENHNDKNQPEGDWKFMWSHVHKPVKDMFWHTFHKDGKRYKNRPSSDEWLKVFEDYRRQLSSESATNFDPMSNDVYPIRPKAFKSDTPIKDCPECKRRYAIVGKWNDDKGEYFIPKSCYKCKAPSEKCQDCGRESSSLKSGLCRECNRKANFSKCSKCGEEKHIKALEKGRCNKCQTVPCKDCRKQFSKTDLERGRCKQCTKKATSLDPSRLCADCDKPYISFSHVTWYEEREEYLDVPKSHRGIKEECKPVKSVSKEQPKKNVKSVSKEQPKKKKGIFSWLSG